jgi:glutamyl-tRNA reductase
VEEREPLQLQGEELARAGALFGTMAGVMESAIVPTCNRIEFYVVAARGSDPLAFVSRFYRQFKDLDLEPYRSLFRVETGKRAAEHLFRVSAGIDSMVLGENQILGQVKSAYSTACAVKSAGKVIHRLFHQAFRVGKQVRSDTAIGQGACSVSTAAVEMLSDEVRALDRPKVLFVGVNQMIQLAAKRLALVDGAVLSFANRTPAKARALAAAVGGAEAAAYGLEELPDLLATADIVISCTSSPEPVITRDMVTAAATRRSGRRLVIVDLAVPRDVDPTGVREQTGGDTIALSDLEDVKRFVANRQQRRQEEIPRAEEIIERRLDEFDYWYGHVQHEPIYNGAGVSAESIREEELAPIIERLPPEMRDEFNRATRRLVDRVVKAVKRSSNDQRE